MLVVLGWFCLMCDLERFPRLGHKLVFCMELNKAIFSSNTRCSASKLWNSAIWLNVTMFFTAVKARCFISAVLASRFCFALSVHGSLEKLAFAKWDKYVEGTSRKYSCCKIILSRRLPIPAAWSRSKSETSRLEEGKAYGKVQIVSEVGLIGKQSNLCMQEMRTSAHCSSCLNRLGTQLLLALVSTYQGIGSWSNTSQMADISVVN